MDQLALDVQQPDEALPAWIVALLLALVIGIVYGRALDAPFIFDDRSSIITNGSIHKLWPLVGTGGYHGPLNPPNNIPITARPLVNLTLAINYYLGGLNPIGYHLVNVLLHYFCALLLWGIVRRTLRLPYFAGRFTGSADWLALAVAFIWALHPLQTETVIYATQRTELMMALFYLATLYCSLRYWTASASEVADGDSSTPTTSTASRQRPKWLALAVVSCLCGMASKEVMVSAPLMMLLFDRTFVSGSLANALRRSWPLHVGLAATWGFLGLLVYSASYDTGAGFGLGIPAHVWLFTQARALLMYLKLSIWPWPLLIHYHWTLNWTFASAWMYVVPVVLLGLATLFLLWRNNPVGFLGTSIFAILSPTLVIPILLEVAAERRMYLPLAALVALYVVGGYMLAQAIWRWRTSEDESSFNSSGLLKVLSGTAAVLVLVLGLVSATRLAAYNDEITLWEQVLDDQPGNFVAHNNYGLLLYHENKIEESVAEFRRAMELNPAFPDTLNNLGIALNALQQVPQAINAFEVALKINPNHAPGNLNLAATYVREGRYDDAERLLRHALKLNPDFIEARCELGNALTKAGRLPEALEELNAAAALRPDFPTTYNLRGIALAKSGRNDEAIEDFRLTLKLNPDYIDPHNNLAIALTRAGKIPEAVEHYELSLKRKPDDPNAHFNYADLLAGQGKMSEAISHFKEAVRLKPDLPYAQTKLGHALRLAGKPDEAIEHYRAAVELTPNNIQAYADVARILIAQDKPEEAIAMANKAIEIARATNQEAAIPQIEKWMTEYQAELQNGAKTEADADTKSPSPAESQ